MEQVNKNTKRSLLIRCDDFGMCHSINVGGMLIRSQGLTFSASLMPPCKWFSEAAEMFKNDPGVATGVHLTLTCDWQPYRWKPVSDPRRVTSLVDSEGFFYSSRLELMARSPKRTEIELELRAQIEMALERCPKLAYLDSHMNVMYKTPDLLALLLDLAEEYGVEVSHSFGEFFLIDLFFAPPGRKLPVLLQVINNLSSELSLLIVHPAIRSREMSSRCVNSLKAGNEVAEERAGELEAITSQLFMDCLKSNGIELLTYSDITSQKRSHNLHHGG